jgi:hypothetical protein
MANTHYHAFSNVAGYLPESDDTGYPFDTFSEALSALVSDLEHAWDFDDATDEQYLDAHTAMHNATGPEFLTYTATHADSEHDIPTAWQVVPCTDNECTADLD